MVPAVAHAEEQAEPVKTAPAPEPRGHFTAGVGSFIAATPAGGGVVVDLLYLGRIGQIGLGGNVQLGAELFGQTHVALAPVLGGFLPMPRRFDVGIFGTAGVHFYKDVGTSELFSQDPGFSATLPFAGVRGVFAVALGKGPAHFTLGCQAFLDVDLMNEVRTYSYDDYPWLFGGQSETITVTHTAGTVRFGGIFALGARF